MNKYEIEYNIRSGKATLLWLEWAVRLNIDALPDGTKIQDAKTFVLRELEKLEKLLQETS